jgi:predicted amidohydrolase YtcJ
MKLMALTKEFTVLILFQGVLLLSLFVTDRAQAADLILLNGNIITVDERFSIVQAVAIKNDKFIAIGSDKEIGKLVDLAILSQDLLSCPVDQIKNIRVELTIVGGKIVYSSGVVN